MAKYYDKKHKRDLSLKRGKEYGYSEKNIATRRPSDSLGHVKIGPYEIENKISPVNYRFKLPSSMKIHPTFHVSLLEKSPLNARTVVYEADAYGQDAEEWQFEMILDKQLRNGKLY